MRTRSHSRNPRSPLLYSPETFANPTTRKRRASHHRSRSPSITTTTTSHHHRRSRGRSEAPPDNKAKKCDMDYDDEYGYGPLRHRPRRKTISDSRRSVEPWPRANHRYNTRSASRAATPDIRSSTEPPRPPARHRYNTRSSSRGATPVVVERGNNTRREQTPVSSEVSDNPRPSSNHHHHHYQETKDSFSSSSSSATRGRNRLVGFNNITSPYNRHYIGKRAAEETEESSGSHFEMPRLVSEVEMPEVKIVEVSVTATTNPPPLPPRPVRSSQRVSKTATFSPLSAPPRKRLSGGSANKVKPEGKKCSRYGEDDDEIVFLGFVNPSEKGDPEPSGSNPTAAAGTSNDTIGSSSNTRAGVGRRGQKRKRRLKSQTPTEEASNIPPRLSSSPAHTTVREKSGVGVDKKDERGGYRLAPPPSPVETTTMTPSMGSGQRGDGEKGNNGGRGAVGEGPQGMGTVQVDVEVDEAPEVVSSTASAKGEKEETIQQGEGGSKTPTTIHDEQDSGLATATDSAATTPLQSTTTRQSSSSSSPTSFPPFVSSSSPVRSTSTSLPDPHSSSPPPLPVDPKVPSSNSSDSTTTTPSAQAPSDPCPYSSGASSSSSSIHPQAAREPEPANHVQLPSYESQAPAASESLDEEVLEEARASEVMGADQSRSPTPALSDENNDQQPLGTAGEIGPCVEGQPAHRNTNNSTSTDPSASASPLRSAERMVPSTPTHRKTTTPTTSRLASAEPMDNGALGSAAKRLSPSKTPQQQQLFPRDQQHQHFQQHPSYQQQSQKMLQPTSQQQSNWYNTYQLYLPQQYSQPQQAPAACPFSLGGGVGMPSTSSSFTTSPFAGPPTPAPGMFPIAAAPGGVNNQCCTQSMQTLLSALLADGGMVETMVRRVVDARMGRMAEVMREEMRKTANQVFKRNLYEMSKELNMGGEAEEHQQPPPMYQQENGAWAASQQYATLAADEAEDEEEFRKWQRVGELTADMRSTEAEHLFANVSGAAVAEQQNGGGAPTLMGLRGYEPELQDLEELLLENCEIPINLNSSSSDSRALVGNDNNSTAAVNQHQAEHLNGGEAAANQSGAEGSSNSKDPLES